MFKKTINSLRAALQSVHRTNIKDEKDIDFFIVLDEEDEANIDAEESSSNHQNGISDTTFFVREELFRLKELRKLLLAFLKRIEDAISEFEAKEEYYHLTFDGDIGAKALADHFKSYAQKLIVRIYELVEDSNVFSNATTSETGETASNMYGIHAFSFENLILLTLPMLGSTWRKTTSKGDTLSAYGSIFQKTISAEIQRLFEQDSSVNPEVFRQKTISYFYNYHSDDARIMDSDNHASKPITDAICTSLPGSDAGPLTSFFYATTVKNSIPKATYIIISPGKNSPQSDQILERLSYLFLQ